MAMRTQNVIPSLDGTIIERIVLIDIVERESAAKYQSVSLPGHLLHFTLSGAVEQELNGHQQHIHAGQVVWHHENEDIKGRIMQAPWKFYTVNFIAPLLLSPSFDQRVIPGNKDIAKDFEQLHQTWQDMHAPPTLRHMQLHAQLLNLLTEIMPTSILNNRIDKTTQLWWELEETIRQDLSQPLTLSTLEKMSAHSKRSIIRACHLATNTSPMKRIKEIRLSYGQGLVLHSQRSMTDIAFSIGYARVQEFSRDYHQRYGVTPTEARKQGPKYRELDGE